MLLLFLLALPQLLQASATPQKIISGFLFNPTTDTIWLEVRDITSTNSTIATAIIHTTASGTPPPSSTAIAIHPRSLQQSSSPAATPKNSSTEHNSCGKLQMFAMVAVVCLVIFPVVGLSIYVQQRKVADDHVLGEALRNLPGMPREFRYAELSRGTGGFSETNTLGKGGFGTVYRGTVGIAGTTVDVAVKTFSRETSRGDFLAELTIINRLRHRNLVPLKGWCYKNKKLLLVYEYMPNGSLDNHLFSDAAQMPLPWESRYNILKGVASALHYLHNEYHQKVIHRDVKASNILLDSSFNGCLGDFGLARAVDVGDNSAYEDDDGVPGTPGYLAPECFHTMKATSKSDVYAFGAVVLEVVCGRRPRLQIGRHRMLVDWVWSMYKDGKLLEVVDRRLGVTGYPIEDVERLLLLGLACCHPNPSQRPKTQTILQVLSRSIPPLPVSKQKPTFIFSPLSADNNSTADSSSTILTSDGVSPGFSGCYCPSMAPILDGNRSRETDYFTCNLHGIRESIELSDTSTMLDSDDRSDRQK